MIRKRCINAAGLPSRGTTAVGPGCSGVFWAICTADLSVTDATGPLHNAVRKPSSAHVRGGLVGVHASEKDARGIRETFSGDDFHLGAGDCWHEEAAC